MTPDDTDLDVRVPEEFTLPPEVANGAAPVADPVLEALDRAGGHYRAIRAAREREAQDALDVRGELVEARRAEREAREQLSHLREQLEAERRRAQRHKDRAARMATALKEVHRTLFSGNVYEAILRASMSLTGATRGLYVTALEGGKFQARAAVGVDGYPRKTPSAFVRALCERVRADGTTLVCNEPHEFAELPAPDGPGETFAGCLVAPAVLLDRFNGVVILADKPGNFDDHDEESVMSVGDGAGVAVHNHHLQSELLRAYFSVVAVLADAMEVKDPYTKGHCQSVARYARLTAAKLADSDPKLRSVCCYGGLLHDVGKIGVSDGVLNKPGKLSPEEWALMQSHVRIGRDLLAKVPALDGVVDVILHHHERFDGGGYPDGLSGEQITLAARVIAVVDAYSAMTSKRSYKESLSVEEARAELLRCRGAHFDPAVVDAFLAVLDDPETAADRGPSDATLVLPGLGDADDFHHVLRRG